MKLSKYAEKPYTKHSTTISKIIGKFPISAPKSGYNVTGGLLHVFKAKQQIPDPDSHP
jgi:hypothetical protein